MMLSSISSAADFISIASSLCPIFHVLFSSKYDDSIQHRLQFFMVLILLPPIVKSPMPSSASLTSHSPISTGSPQSNRILTSCFIYKFSISMRSVESTTIFHEFVKVVFAKFFSFFNWFDWLQIICKRFNSLLCLVFNQFIRLF